MFLGNVVNRSPYTLETLALVLRLIEQNPSNIFYIRGSGEFFSSLQGHTLREELEMRAQYLSTSDIPLKEEVNAFFATLPLTVYVRMPWLSEDVVHYFRIASLLNDKKVRDKLKDDLLINFIQKNHEGSIATFDVNNIKEEDENGDEETVKLEAVVREISKRNEWEKTKGLRLLDPKKGVTSWHVFSAPSEPYRGSFSFWYDAFAVITAAKEKEDWNITLYSRHIKKERDKEYHETTYEFFTGSTEGDDENDK